MSYIFRREDNGELVTVDFQAMMSDQKDGFITLPDGVQAKRCVGLEVNKYADSHTPQYEAALTPGGKSPAIVSDSLGFPQHQLAEFERDRRENGFSDVEFRPDPAVPEFYQVHVGSRAEWHRYLQHRGFYDKTSGYGSGAALTPAQFQQAAERVAQHLAEKFPQIPVLAGAAS